MGVPRQRENTIDPNHPFADFRNFIFAVWKHLSLPEPTPLQYDIAYNLQHGTKRQVIEAFRGCGKSYITSAYVVWLLFWNRDLKILVVSASKERADAFSQFCLRLIHDMPQLQHMIPKPGQRRSLVAFDVAGAKVDHSPSVKSVGITGQLTGSRADVIVADDVETPKNSMTVLQREKLKELVKEFDAILKPLTTSRIVYLGTPQCEDSLYNELGKRGYHTMIWPARKPTPMQEAAYEGKLAEYILTLDIKPGTTTDPVRFSDADLQDRELSYGKSGFALQFMLDTSLSDALRYPLKCSDFIVMDVDSHVAPVKVTYASGPDQLLELDCVGLRGDRWFGPMWCHKDFAEYTGSVMYIDPSGRGADRTAVVVVKMLNGTLFVRRAVSLAGGYDEKTLSTIASIAKTEKVNLIQVESNFGDGMFEQLLRPYLARTHPTTIESVHVSKQKELRIIETLEPVLNQHRVVIDKAIVIGDMQQEQSHQLFYQLTRITRDKNALAHDDILDALAGAVAYWTERLDVDQEEAVRRHEDEAFENEYRKFMENALGQGTVPEFDDWTAVV